MSFSKINSIELIASIEEAISFLETSKESQLGKIPPSSKYEDSFDSMDRSMKISYIKEIHDKSIDPLNALLKLAKTNETIYLSAEHAEILYDYSKSYKNRMNKGYR